MDKKRVELTKQQFDLVVHHHEEANIEYWFARELMPLLGYERWENFDKAIIRAMESCETSGIEVMDHFREVTKMIEIGKGGRRPVKDYTALSNTAADLDTENMLIHGDNLLALKALESKYAGQVKCIYIDPPYNIDAMNEYYCGATFPYVFTNCASGLQLIFQATGIPS